MLRPLAALALVALIATGCVTRGSLRRVQDELASVRADVTELRHAQERSVREVAGTTAELRALDARLSEVQAGLRESQAETARLRARLEAAEHELREARAPTAPAPAPPPTSSVPSAVAPAPTERAPRPEVVRPDIARADTAEHAYAAAMANFRAREHGQAVLDLLDFIAKYPKHRLRANAQYWIGEAYYVQRDYRQALVEFGKVLEMAPGSSKAADALLKVGLSYTNLREPARAQQVWQRLVREYPSSDSASKARDYLRARGPRRP